MYDFKPFSKLVNQRFVELSKHELYVVGDDNRAFEALQALTPAELEAKIKALG